MAFVVLRTTADFAAGAGGEILSAYLCPVATPARHVGPNCLARFPVLKSSRAVPSDNGSKES